MTETRPPHNETRIAALGDKQTQVAPAMLLVLGVPVTSRYGKLNELLEMLDFLRLIERKAVLHYVSSLFYDSKSLLCTIETDGDTPRGGRVEATLMVAATLTISQYELFGEINSRPQFTLGDQVRKKSGANWYGTIVGFYSTTLTPDGYCVESDCHPGSVQIYPAEALEHKPSAADENISGRP